MLIFSNHPILVIAVTIGVALLLYLILAVAGTFKEDVPRLPTEVDRGNPMFKSSPLIVVPLLLFIYILVKCFSHGLIF